MFKQAHQRTRATHYVKIKQDGVLTKEHSNLYRYHEGGSETQFVANIGSPTVGGYIVIVEGDAPIYMTIGEFNKLYVES